MKKRIALGAAMLLTLGTAVAGTFLYGHEQSASLTVEPQITLPSDNQSATQTATPEMIAMWKATAASTDYVGTKAPI
ncbi:hypothetical protein [Steroidobacter sp.]|uniref:hypothetical protein n=1 Tax=Steroidobacter sp. TaxID=1978227 RepID=UPI001A5A2077|nr:hypothetical protein [Steroidobacter sp.]MBL8271483.1 hypothetical protein [Steroidobacter sp.]